MEDPSSLAGATMLDTDEAVIIACRGSASARNFRTNFNVGPVPLLTASGPHPTARVHAGFQLAGDELWRRIKPKLPQSKPVLVTGHSLGGGTATMIALRARAAGREPELYTVAGPRLGNEAFAEYYRERCPPARHLLHDDDDVIKSNQKLWDDLGFQHVGDVIRCDKDAACVYEEEEACLTDAPFTGDLTFRGVLVDHCMYMGVYIGLRAQHPSVWLRF